MGGTAVARLASRPAEPAFGLDGILTLLARPDFPWAGEAGWKSGW